MKIMIAIIGAIILAAGGVAAGIYFSKDTEAVPVQQINSLFYPMDRFIVSVGDDGYSRYLVLELSLVTKDPQFLMLLNDVSPLLRNTLVQHFATVTREQAKTMFAEVNNVQSALLEEFQQTLLTQGVVSKLDQVLVTNVFVQ
jgi:flagellar FliL protein